MCPIITFIVIPVYPRVDDLPYTVYVDINYTIMPILLLLQLTS